MLRTQIVVGMLAGAAHGVADPVPNYYNMADPRAGKTGSVGVVAFYYPGHNTPWDHKSKAGFLGNFWSSPLTVQPPNTKGGPDSQTFQNAEAAFQALKFWKKAHEFENLTGDQAYKKKKALGGKPWEKKEDFTYAGYGSNWNGMWAVLQAKFLRPDGTPRYLGHLLKKTRDAYLLEHNSTEGRDFVWSDNMNGTGTNFLGMQLMLLRDQMTGETEWTNYIKTFINVWTGNWINGSTSQKAWLAGSVRPGAALDTTPTPTKPTKPTGTKPTGTKPTGTKPMGTKPMGTKPTAAKASPAAKEGARARKMKVLAVGAAAWVGLMAAGVLGIAMHRLG